MEANAAFVRAYHVVVLDAVAHVGLHLAFVVNPCNAELDNSVRNAKSFDEVGFLKFRVFVVLLFYGREYLAYGLDVFRLIGESAFKILYDLCCIHNLLFY